MYSQLRANFIGTEFVVYDNGNNPKDSDLDSSAGCAGVRQELGLVLYASNVLGSRGPRKMKVHTVCIPCALCAVYGSLRIHLSMRIRYILYTISQVCVPKVDENNERALWQPLRKEDEILAK